MEDDVGVFVAYGERLPPVTSVGNSVQFLVPPEDCRSGSALAEAVSLDADCTTYVVTEHQGSRKWKRMKPNDVPPIIHGEIHIFQVEKKKGPAEETIWGTAKAQKVAPSSMTNSMCIQLQAMDAQGNLKDGESPQFLNFRPVYATPTIPAALAHVAFANFLDVFEGRAGELDKEDVLFFSRLALKCSRYYEDEAAYREEVAELWKAYTGMDFINELNTGAGTRCDLGCRHHALRALFGALEAKLGMFASKSDPGMQAPQYVRLYWLRIGDSARFRATCYPALAIEHIGPFVRISAVYVLNKLCVMPLTPFINLLLLQGHNMPAALQAVRLCKATKLALQELSDFYKSPGFAHPEMLIKGIPHPLQQSNRVPRRLVDGKLVFVLPNVVVKYVQGFYGEAVHRAWAGAGFAPQLYDVRQLPGAWWEVRMEYLGEGWCSLHGHPQAEELRAEVLSVLDRAHKVPVTPSGTGGVHGDARDVNVMVRITPGGQVEVKFIDFDWAAVDGIGRYPYFMNHFGVNWPAGVSDGQPMLQRHDKELLQMSQDEQTKEWGLSRVHSRWG